MIRNRDSGQRAYADPQSVLSLNEICVVYQVSKLAYSGAQVRYSHHYAVNLHTHNIDGLVHSVSPKSVSRRNLTTWAATDIHKCGCCPGTE